MNSHTAACQRVARLFPQRWLRHYAASKLRSDPVFATAFELLRDSDQPLLDVGCGVGLLPLYLRARGFRPPIMGIDRDARKIRQAAELARDADELTFVERDGREPLPAFSGNVALLDMLHYIDRDAQQALLAQLNPCVAPDAILLLRDAIADRTPRFWCTYAAERFAQMITWNVTVPLHFPRREAISEALVGLQCDERPAYGMTPFNNRLFVFRRETVAARPLAHAT